MRLGSSTASRLLFVLAPVVTTGCSSIEFERPEVARTTHEVSSPPVDPPGGAGPARPAEDRRIFDEANRMRAEHGLAPFRWSDRLHRAAHDHSAEQARHGYMGHGSPDPARDDLADRLRLADCGALRAWAEVVAFGYEGPVSVVNGWMNSRGHRKILLDPNLEEAGFARVGAYFTGDFATRR